MVFFETLKECDALAMVFIQATSNCCVCFIKQRVERIICDASVQIFPPAASSTLEQQKGARATRISKVFGRGGKKRHMCEPLGDTGQVKRRWE